MAADFTAHSVRLTLARRWAGAGARTVAEILHRAAAGETARAVAMLDAVMSTLPPGRERMAALMLRAGLDFGQPRRSSPRPTTTAESDELLRGRVLDLLAYMPYMYRGVPRARRRMATEALASPTAIDDAELQMLAAVNLATTALLAGAPQPATDGSGRWSSAVTSRPAPRTMARRRTGAPRSVGRAAGHGTATFERLQQMTADSGIEFQRPYRLGDLAAVELAAGHLAVAARARRRRHRVGDRRRQPPRRDVVALPGWAGRCPPWRRRASQARSRRAATRGAPSTTSCPGG